VIRIPLQQCHPVYHRGTPGRNGEPCEPADRLPSPQKISGEVSKASFARISREQQFIVSMLRRRDTVSSFQLVFME